MTIGDIRQELKGMINSTPCPNGARIFSNIFHQTVYHGSDSVCLLAHFSLDWLHSPASSLHMEGKMIPETVGSCDIYSSWPQEEKDFQNSYPSLDKDSAYPGWVMCSLLDPSLSPGNRTFKLVSLFRHPPLSWGIARSFDWQPLYWIWAATTAKHL